MPLTVESATPLTVTLLAQDWGEVLNALAERPFRIAAPILQRLNQQLETAANLNEKQNSESL